VAKKSTSTGKKSAVIRIEGARQHNLKSLNLDIAHNTLTVITGPSGSGKSSLAFHTLYAEGQRRYVETFSPYIRQFFDRMDKPDVDLIDGILPAIAIEQKNHVRTTRSTVGTLTEINDYLKVLFGRAAKGYDPQTGEEIQPDSPESALAWLFEHRNEQSMLVLFRVRVPEKATPEDFFPLLNQQGFLRVLLYGKMFRTDEPAECSYKSLPAEMWIVQDRIQIKARSRSRVLEALEAAARHGKGTFATVSADEPSGTMKEFTNDWVNPATGFKLCEPSAGLFSFNSPRGACVKCRGFGRVIGIDLAKAVPDPTLSIRGGAIKPFLGERGEECQRDLLRCCKTQGLNVNTPWEDLSVDEQDWVKYGEGGDPESNWREAQWYGIKGFFDWLESKAYKMHVRVFLSRYRSYTECPDCRGKRLRPEALCFRVEGKTLPEIWNTPVCDLAPWFAGLPAHEPSLELVRKEIHSRLQYLNDVGLGYLTLDRQTRTLSGGEMERVNLTTCLGAALTNTLFVLDEPTVGLHARDIHRLVGVMKGLRDKGNTIVVVEHEEAVMTAADEIIDIGPLAGDGGGTLVYQGPAVNPKQKTGTIPWLDGRMSIPLPTKRRKPSKKQITIQGATRHNLKKLDLTLPLGLFVCLSGVSGSGKSTLAHDVLYLNLAKKLGREISDDGEPALIKSISGTEHVQEVLLVDQSSLARTPRSTPAVFCGAFDVIRQLMTETDQAKASSLQPGYFSFNSGEGRCDRCAGAGFERVEMQFLSDIQVTCPDCNGKRYRLSALEFLLEKKNISEILELSVSAAIEFFRSIANQKNQTKKNASLANKVCDLLHPLARVGLGYLRLGQPLNTLSGGESQRLKLCQLLDPKAHQNKLLILDEPTTGLHFSDIATLLDVFQQLVEAGNSLLVIEHQLDVMAAADWLIDLGPGAGADGGRIIGTGTPETIAATDSETALYLRSKLGLPGSPVTKVTRVSKPAILPNEISLHGARHHNLKNVSLAIPRDQFVVISGLSGSGKSTLAFDILFAEGQRRFLDSMSAYARQFADQLEKPDIDHLSGLPPTVAIEQRISQGGGKSTVATITEVWNFIRLLYAKLGIRYCCGKPVEKQSLSSMEQSIRSALSKGPVKLFAPLIRGRKGYHNEVAEWALKHGYTMMLADKRLIPAENFQRLERFKEHDVDVMIFEFSSAKDPIGAKLEEALKIGKGSVRILTAEKKFHILSSSQSCATCGTSYEDLDPRHFSFNSPHGWCTDCRGYGLVPRKRHALDLSRFDSLLAAEVDEERSLERMDPEDLITCPTCDGARLHLHSRQVQVADVAIEAIAQRSIQDAAEHFSALKFPEKRQQMIARDIIPEIHQRLQFLSKVGLGYLQLSRSARTLSGGESQRIRLAAQLGSNLRGVLYVLDEPTIGLHPRDNAALLDTLVSLRDRGNSLVVVEHDEDTIARADWLIDLGPAAGRLGGQIVYEGKPPRLGQKHSAKSIEHSPTLRAMSMEINHPSRGKRRPVDKKQAFLSLSGCSVNNLKQVSVSIPIGCLTVLTGVSGSGKSSLMHGCLSPAARNDKPNKKGHAGYTKALNMELIDAVYEVDQSPIGKTSRSCPATYVGIFDEIRKVFAQLPEARARGFEATRFSFNTEGGRCEECKGNGRIKLEMDFLPSAWIPCEICQGKRYNSATLEVTYKDQSIADVLAMPIEEAARFFETHSRLAEPLRLLNETGLGYLTLGQASPTLSGGEAQRIKLISEIARGRSLRKRMANLKNAKGNLYLIEEPTVGLHLEDVRRLIDVLHRMVDEGHTVVVIEHHMAVAAEADWIIDVGPEAGADGGEIVAQGPPELVARSKTSRTAPFLAEFLKHSPD
jgi:excinuclease ABC subunit A